MNKIRIGKRDKNDVDASTFGLTYDNANKMLPVLRSDHFKEVVLSDVSEVEVKMLKFLIQLSRLLKSDVPTISSRAQSPSRMVQTNNYRVCLLDSDSIKEKKMEIKSVLLRKNLKKRKNRSVESWLLDLNQIKMKNISMKTNSSRDKIFL